VLRRHGAGGSGVSLDEKSGEVKVDPASFAVVGCPSVYAAGDVIGAPALASTSVEQAKSAVAHMFGEEDDHALMTAFPVGVWTIPEIGYFGLTKAAALKKGIVAEEGMARYDECLRGRVFAPVGFLKMVFDKGSGVIIGVHIFGSDACELIHYGMELVRTKATIFSVLTSLFTAVTFHELFKFAALSSNAKLQFGIQWASIFKELEVVFAEVDMPTLKAKFEELDTDKSGALSPDELHAMFVALGKTVSKGTLANMVRLADDDCNGVISFEEFSNVIGHIKVPEK